MYMTCLSTLIDKGDHHKQFGEYLREGCIYQTGKVACCSKHKL
jgi:hypothetical protein